MTAGDNGDEFIDQLIKQQQLPSRYRELVSRYLQPLAEDLAIQQRSGEQLLVVGINGSQGSGKSTLCLFLQSLLQQRGLCCEILSIDDLYLSRSRRQKLARDQHPLLATRGVPGTHDVTLGVHCIEQLRAGLTTALPRFDKAIDDCLPIDQWRHIDQPVDVLLFEGWCLGAQPQPDSELDNAINDLERDEDCDGHWRRFVNQQLAGAYRDLFQRIDLLLMLEAPSMACVSQWRTLQEQKLQARCQRQGRDATAVMGATQLSRFIQHYERLTRYMLGEMPKRADYLLRLSPEHDIVDSRAPAARTPALAATDTLVFTDLDGTLLDHNSYDFNPAKPALAELQRRGIPIIINSSKTACEIIAIQQQLGIRQPFICENGAAVYIPHSHSRDWWTQCFSRPRNDCLRQLQRLREQHQYHFTGFSDCSTLQITELTGLSAVEARRANDRDYSEPLLWLDSPERLEDFRIQLRTEGLDSLIGGRFLCVIGGSNFDKGLSMDWLVERYSEHNQHRAMTTIALGDSDNDLAMLNAATFAVQIAAHKPSPLKIHGPQLILRSELAGPEGWQWAITELLE